MQDKTLKEIDFDCENFENQIIDQLGARLAKLTNTLPALETDLQRLAMRGGMDALRTYRSASTWVQYGIAFRDGCVFAPDIMRALHKAATNLLADGSANNFFFMHKTPGLRVRFQGSDRLKLREAVRCRLGALADAHTDILRVEESVYEPEDQLFGGAESMTHVHLQFTLDSLNWLAVHGRRTHLSDKERWALSFAYLNSVYSGLGIVGWEDLGVWAYIVRNTGRNLAGAVRASQDAREIQHEICQIWDTGPDIDGLKASEVAYYRSLNVARSLAAAWRQSYFEQPGALIAPRQAAAYLTIYHWNRAGIPALHQNLIASALASRRRKSEAELDAGILAVRAL